MSNANAGRMVVGLDIGTSKVVAIVGAINDEGKLEVVGCLLYTSPSPRDRG